MVKSRNCRANAMRCLNSSPRSPPSRSERSERRRSKSARRPSCAGAMARSSPPDGPVLAHDDGDGRALGRELGWFPGSPAPPCVPAWFLGKCGGSQLCYNIMACQNQRDNLGPDLPNPDLPNPDLPDPDLPSSLAYAVLAYQN